MVAVVCCLVYPAQCLVKIQLPIHRRRQRSGRYTLAYQDPASSADNAAGVANRYRRIPQVRRKPQNRKPRNYWLDLRNIETDFHDFWTSIHVDHTISRPPPIPNEALLNYYKRYDLRAAIVTHGGRRKLASDLGGSFIIPGKWAAAVNTTYIQQAIENDPGLSLDSSPLSPQQLKRGYVRDNVNIPELGKEEIEQTQGGRRREKGFWSSDVVVIQELCVYSYFVKLKKGS